MQFRVIQLRIVLSQFWRDLRAQRLRTGLTLFGLAWGTFCVILLLSFGEGLSRKQMDSTAGMGTRIILIWGSRTSIPFQGLPRGRYVPLEDGDSDAIIRQVAGVSNASPEYANQGAMLKGPKGESGASMSGVRPGFAAMRRIIPEAGGRFLNERDERERRRVCFLGDQIRKDLFGEIPVVGKTVEISGLPFLIVGTMAAKKQDSNYNGRDDRKVFIPSSVAVATFGQRYPSNLVVEVAEGAKSKEVMDGVYRVMGGIHHFDADDHEALMSWDVGEMIAMLQTVFNGFRIFLGLIGVLTLAVAGIGVANIMNMVVEDRTAQIGIAMAMGARRAWVLGQILLETMIVTAVGGGMGIVFAVGVVTAAKRFMVNSDIGTPVFSWEIAVLTASLLALIGVISGMGPARRAAYLNPAVALRS
jgi:putative ABC transport system permease protein